MSLAFALSCAVVFLSGMWGVTHSWGIARPGERRFVVGLALPRAVAFMAAGLIGAVRGDWVTLIVAVLVAIVVTWVSLILIASKAKAQ